MTPGLTTVVKWGPALLVAAVAPTTVAKPFFGWIVDPQLVIVVTIGLLLGVMFRAGLMVNQKQSFAKIKRDFIVSLLISGANFVLSINVITLLGITQFHQALGIAVVVSATGVKSGLMACKWVWNRLIQQEIDDIQGEKRQASQRLKSSSYLASRELGNQKED